jgi:hypothetical protein
VITAKLLVNNIILESLQLQNNSITQIEKDFYKPLTKLLRADFSTNLCISETIQLSRFIQWSSQLLKFKDCFNNFVLLRPVNGVIGDIQSKIDNLETQVADTLEKVDNDLKVLENKMDNDTDLQTFKTDLLKFFEADRENIEKKYEEDITNITSAVRTDLMEQIEQRVVAVLEKTQEAKQEKLVNDDFSNIRDEFAGKFTLIYVTLGFMICFACIAAFFILRTQSIYPIFSSSRHQADRNNLIEAEVC